MNTKLHTDKRLRRRRRSANRVLRGAEFLEQRCLLAADLLATDTVAPLVEVVPVVTDMLGQPIDRVELGTEFLLQFHVRDLRPEAEADGVYAAFVDVLFDTSMAETAGEENTLFASPFAVLQRPANLLDDGFDELGAASASIRPLGNDTQVICTVHMRATSLGQLTFDFEAADNLDSEMLIYGSNDPVQTEQVRYGATTVGVYEHIPPSLEIDLLPQYDSGAVDWDNVTNQEELVFQVSGFESEGTQLYVSINGQQVATHTATAQSEQVELSLAEYGDGVHEIEVTALDLHTVVFQEGRLSVTLDTEISTEFLNESIFRLSTQIDTAFNIEHVDETSHDVTYRVVEAPDGVEIGAVNGIGTWDSVKTLGSHTVEIVAVDRAGNEAPATFELEVSHRQPELIDGYWHAVPEVDEEAEAEILVEETVQLVTIRRDVSFPPSPILAPWHSRALTTDLVDWSHDVGDFGNFVYIRGNDFEYDYGSDGYEWLLESSELLVGSSTETATSNAVAANYLDGFKSGRSATPFLTPPRSSRGTALAAHGTHLPAEATMWEHQVQLQEIYPTATQRTNGDPAVGRVTDGTRNEDSEASDDFWAEFAIDDAVDWRS